MTASPMQTPADVIEAVVSRPFQQIGEVILTSTALGKTFAVLAGVIAWIRGDIFLLTVTLYVIAAGLDWFLGRRLAHAEHRFSSEKAQGGLLVKGALILEVGLIWLIGREVAGYFGGGWGGAVATILLAFAVMDELDSVETNRVALGGRPLPAWSKAITMLRGATDRLNLLKADETKPDEPRARDAGG